jgi:hypothetical protein
LTACPTINSPSEETNTVHFNALSKKLFLLRNLPLARLAAIVYRELILVNQDNTSKKYMIIARKKIIDYQEKR